MRRSHIITFATTVLGISGCGMLTTAFGLATDSARREFWVGSFVACGAITLISAIVALVAALGDREETQRLERRHKMIPLIGMIVSAIGLIGFGGWYFWPAPTAKVPQSPAKPPPHTEKYGATPPNMRADHELPVAEGLGRHSSKALPTAEVLSQFKSTPTPAPNRIVIECHQGGLGKIKLPGRQRAYMLQLPDYQAQAGGFFMEQFSLNEDGELDYSSFQGNGPLFVTICEVTNQTDNSFVNLKFPENIKSWNTIHLEPNQTKLGDFAYELHGQPVIPQLPANGKFTFYIWNFGPKYHEISFGTLGTGTSTTSGNDEDVKVFSTVKMIESWPNPPTAAK